MTSVGAVILAAGASTRMGLPKQLLPYQGRSLLRHTVEETLAADLSPVVLVLGACVEPSIREIADLPVRVVENSDWRDGTGSSIRAGLTALGATVDGVGLDGVLLAVCDQPHYSAEVARLLTDEFRRASAPLVASSYGDAVGVPAVFSPALFPALLALRGAEGARKVIQEHLIHARTVPFPDGALNIDTLDDYERLQAAETAPLAFHAI